MHPEPHLVCVYTLATLNPLPLPQHVLQAIRGAGIQVWLARAAPPCCGPGAAEVTGQSWVFRDRLDPDMDIGGFREPPHWLQRAGTREVARQPVLARPDLLPHNIQESHRTCPHPPCQGTSGKQESQTAGLLPYQE